MADFSNPDLDMLNAPITAKAEFWASAQTFAQRERDASQLEQQWGRKRIGSRMENFLFYYASLTSL